MKNHPPALWALLWALVILLCSPTIRAGTPDTLRIMDYNILNYPGNTGTARDPYFRNVVHTAKPDVIVTLENTSQAGVNEFLNSVLNYYQTGLYSTIPFLDGPDTDPHIFYKSSKVTFLDASYFLMVDGYRNNGVFKIKVNSTDDTLILYAVHLKASQGYETNRFNEATQIRDTLNNLPSGTKFMVMGDYNFYTGTEPGFVKLTESAADNDGRLKDPINQVGNWHDNAAYSLVHTQSSRIATLSDGGASGGLDDRFDFILTSYSSLDNNTIVSSYKAYGNDGNHLNKDINLLPNAAVPDSVANSLYYASDHLPVICDFKFVTAGTIPSVFGLLTPSNGSTNQAVSGTLQWNTSSNATSYDVYLGTTNPPISKVSADQVDTAYNYSGLNNGVMYYWKVVAKNANGTADATGSPWNFTTIQLPPATFDLLLPANFSVNQPISGSLSWQSSTNATGYDVYLGTTNSPTTRVSSNQAGTSYSYSGLSYSTVYYWKVMAKNSIDSVVATNSPWSFQTIAPPPAAFSLTSPSYGATNQPISGMLIWLMSTGATSYDVYLGTTNPPTTKVDSNRTDTSYAYSGLSGGTIYYWKIISKNSYGSSTATNAPYNFTTLALPASPTSASTSFVTSSSLQLNWVDNASNEAGYRVYRSINPGGPFAQVNGDLPPNTTSFSDTGLQINQRYYYRIVPFNIIGEGNYNTINCATLAIVPVIPGISDVHSSSLKLTLSADLNPLTTQFAIKAVDDTVVRYIQSTGSLGITPTWQTYSDWGGITGFVVNNLRGCRTYLFSVKARNLDNLETGFGPEASQSFACNILTMSVAGGWNIVSLPVGNNILLKNEIFPTSTSDAFAYKGSYIVQDSLSHGIGYWLKYSGDASVNIQGDSLFVDTIAITTGWNLIGSLSSPLSVTSITTEPAGIINSDFFGFSDSYQRTDSLFPGKGFWVKASANGKLVLLSQQSMLMKQTSSEINERIPGFVGSITFEDKNGIKQTLYLSANKNMDMRSELPPVPPNSSFDVRFKSNRYIENISNGNTDQEFPILLQAMQYPVKISWNISQSDIHHFKFFNEQNTLPLEGNGNMLIENESKSISLIVIQKSETLIPKEITLLQNYPNPFNPSTSIQYGIPSKGHITLKIYNLLGEIVATLVDELQDAGYHTVSWQSEVGSGIYFYRLNITETGNPSAVQSLVKQLILVK